MDQNLALELKHLAEAERHIAEGKERITEQERRARSPGAQPECDRILLTMQGTVRAFEQQREFILLRIAQIQSFSRQPDNRPGWRDEECND